MFWRSLFLLAAVPFLSAQPTVFLRGIVNAGSSAPAGLPSGGIARGSLFTIYGSGIGPTTGVSATTYPVGTNLGGVTINVIQGSTQVSALPVYVSAGQVNALMPSNAPLGMASITVSFGGRASGVIPIRVVQNSLGLLTINGTGSGPGVVQNNMADGTVPVNTPHITATPGQAITIYATGLGPITAPDNIAPPAGNLPVTVDAWVGGQVAKVLYSGRSPCCSGLDQIVLQIPLGAPTGCWVPVYIRTAGTTLSNAVTIAIDANGKPCSEPVNTLASAFLSGGKLGTLRLFRSSTRMDLGVQAPVESANDIFQFDLAQSTGGDFSFSPLFSQPPQGSCTVFLATGDLLSSGAPTPVNVNRRLDAGASFTLTGSGGAQTLTPFGTEHDISLGSFAPILPNFNNQLTLNAGQYTIAGTGGADVGKFSTVVNFPAAFTWTGRDTLSLVDRTQPLALAWTGVPTGQSLAILGASFDRPTNSSAMFYCAAPQNAAGFTVPAEIFSTLPATRPNILQSKGVIYLLTMTPLNGVAFTVPGLDAAVAITGHMIGKTVRFQ
jgi:uncharacterized protein (TIGR03437 family)